MATNDREREFEKRLRREFPWARDEEIEAASHRLLSATTEILAAEVGVLREALEAAKAEAELTAEYEDDHTRGLIAEALREALTALLAASLSVAGHVTTTEDWNAYCAAVDAARAAAAAVLGTGANLGDSGMSQPGGVSDGPQ